MSKLWKRTILIAALGGLSVSSTAVLAGSDYQLVTGKEFDAAVPKDFYLEGNAIPTEKRNAVLLKTPAGARVLFALIDTTGYSSQIQKKYIGMLISEAQISIGGVPVGVGSYGFGVEKAGGNAAGYRQPHLRQSLYWARECAG